MADAYFAAGLAANACVNAQGIVVTNEHALADFQKAKLQNGRMWEPFISGTAVSNWEAVFDMNMIPDPSFEGGADGVAPDGWVIDTGTPTVSNAQAHDGSLSLRLNSAGETCHRDFEVVTGARYRLEVALYGGGTELVQFFLIDLGTGKYKTSASETSWTTTPTALFTKTTTGFANNTQTLVIDAQGSGGSGITKLRLVPRKDTGTQAAYVDLILLYPEIDFASLHDHTLPDNVSVEIHRSDDNFVGDDDTETTLPTRRFRTYSKFTPTSTTPKRWWKILASGLPFDPFRFGQPFLGPVQTFARTPANEYTVRRVMPQGGLLGSNGGPRLPVNLAEESRLELELQFGGLTVGLAQAVEDFYMASGFGAEPVIVVPNSDRPEIIYGRLRAQHEFQREGPVKFNWPVTVREDPSIIETI